MVAGHQTDTSWMWHPSFTEERKDTAGLFVHFRRNFTVTQTPPASLPIHITADTRYKLYVNGALVSYGPVKGDSSIWFYDEIDLGPHLHQGLNFVFVVVLRFFHSSSYAVSFPRLPCGGLRVVVPQQQQSQWDRLLGSGTLWETAVDHAITLRVDEPEDDFLHIYEHVASPDTWADLTWVPAKLLEYEVSTGNSTPWNLSPRLIPPMKHTVAEFKAIHNLQSGLPQRQWEPVLLHPHSRILHRRLCLPPESTHVLDLEAPHHMTAFLRFCFERPFHSGASMTITYAESYEDEPALVPYLRRKGHRRDITKKLYGPKDIYHFQGSRRRRTLDYDQRGDKTEVYAPFHFRTFRYIRLTIDTGPSELVLCGIDIEQVNYSLDIQASLQVSEPSGRARQLWDTSLLTLSNCMHDCYEDCPFYEQLQYAMDTRSSALFTYYVSGDDRLARQAIVQLHSSFNARTGLTASRAPSHKTQIIPHFSLFWICMLCDHWKFFGDKTFLAPFLPVADAVLNYFHFRIDPALGLVKINEPGVWNFVDWADQWRPYGIPPAAVEQGVSTYTNNLYAYTLKQAAAVMGALGRRSLAEEYVVRANQLVLAIRLRCFDGDMFTDSIVSAEGNHPSYSQHNQVWAIISGAAGAGSAQNLLRRILDPRERHRFTPTSISMSFYTLRALSMAGGNVYDELFHTFWEPWIAQLELGLTTWEEDVVSHRSDCHAWGSAPIYEFMAEVAGLSPASPGWSSIRFQPRLDLYPDLVATVPLPMKGGVRSGKMRVSWASHNGETVVNLQLDGLCQPASIPVYVKLPSQPVQLLNCTGNLTFVVKLEAKKERQKTVGDGQHNDTTNLQSPIGGEQEHRRIVVLQ